MTMPGPPKEQVESVPGWVVSFGDMVTNLIACFVLLLSMATDRAALYEVGAGSCKRAMQSFGLPDWLMGKGQPEPFDYTAIKYPAAEAPPEQAPSRVRDAEDQQIRRAFELLQSRVDVTSRDCQQQTLRPVICRAKFAPRSHALDAAGRAALDDQVSTLRGAGKGLTLYVVGLAPDSSGQAALELSHARAQAAEQYLRDRLASERLADDWTLCSVGAGTGGDYLRRFDVREGETHLILLVKRAS
jgi:outer membrane protein OmpA-like peptidoglycan-associated protein